MSTAAASRLALRAPVAQRERIFYSSMAVVMALTVGTGFAPTYYLKAFGEGTMATISGHPFTPLVHLHALLFTSWVVLFIVQTALVATRRVAVHRRLGIAGGLLAAAMVIVGMATAIKGAAGGSAPPRVDPLAFLAIPLFDMLLFTLFVSAALWLRANREAHKRLMLLAYISIIVAGVARLPGLLPLGPLAFFGLTTVFLLIAVIYDFITRRRVHNVYI